MNKHFSALIQKYHTIDWLLKCVERERNADRSTTDKLNDRANLYATSEFLQILADIAIRLSNNSVITKRLPTNQEFSDFINLYINTNDSNHSGLIKKYGLMSMIVIVGEQIKFKYPFANILGRVLTLYKNYEKTIEEVTGLNITDIVTIYFAIQVIYEHKDRYVFRASDITINSVESLHEEKIKKFLDFFSIDTKSYRTTLRVQGIDKHNLFTFRLLEKFPIIKFGDEQYIVPSITNLIYSITSNMYIHLLTHFADVSKKESKTYLDTLGDEFEQYVRLLTSKVFEKMIEAKDIVSSGLRAEFVIEYKNTSIVVEVKKLNLKRDTIYKGNMDDMNELLENHILKAYKQIENTFKYIDDKKDKIGLIITFGDIHSTTQVPRYMKEYFTDQGAEFDDRIIITSIGNFESLFANKEDKIIDILNEYLSSDEQNKSEFILRLESNDADKVNPFLYNEFSSAIDKMKPDDKLLEENTEKLS